MVRTAMVRIFMAVLFGVVCGSRPVADDVSGDAVKLEAPEDEAALMDVHGEEAVSDENEVQDDEEGGDLDEDDEDEDEYDDEDMDDFEDEGEGELEDEGEDDADLDEDDEGEEDSYFPHLEKFRPKNCQGVCSVLKRGVRGISHTIVMALEMPEETSLERREWLLNIGQESPGAHHWIWNKKEFVQFGSWGPFRNGLQINIAKGLAGAETLATVWSKKTKKYSLFINGVCVATKSTGHDIFHMISNNIAIGGNRVYEKGQKFSGCIHGVDVYRRAMTASAVKKAADRILEDLH